MEHLCLRMLHEFLISNRNELIGRCREKAAKRHRPLAPPAEVDHGVPLFLQQLTDTLQREQTTAARETAQPESTPANSEVGSVGTTGATSTLLLHTLGELRTLTEQSLPEIHLAAANTSVSPH